MAATIDIESEAGTCVDSVHRHQGYWAGDFSARAPQAEQA